MSLSVPATSSATGRRRSRIPAPGRSPALRQSFLNGSLTRLVDPDATLKAKIVEFVTRGEFGLASGKSTDGAYERVWFKEMVAPDEVTFEAGVFLLRKAAAEALRARQPATPDPGPEPEPAPDGHAVTAAPTASPGPGATASTRTLRLLGTIPPEVWNRLGTRILPKLRSGSDLKLGLEFSVSVSVDTANGLATELRQILQELSLADAVKVE